MTRPGQIALVAAVALFGLVAPLVFASFRTEIALLWVMVLFALTWDLMGGQAGYNSFGNVLFFGLGMYASAVLQRDAGLGYFPGLFLGMALGAAIAVVAAAVLGAMILGMRGHYFAIATLGLGIGAGEIAAGWGYVGAGSGMVPPLYPGSPAGGYLFFCYLFFAEAAIVFGAFALIYRSRFGLVLNAIRDNEDKAEALGLRTGLVKTVGWMISAFFLGLAGGGVGNMLGFIDPHDTAFAASTYGVWMVLMAILGGKGTLWGPVLGAVIFDVTQELLWANLLGWQRVALGVIIVAIVVFFPQGILGWARERWPERFGHRIETS